ncbi:hypothetical protein [Muricauda brasiliensis]|uniref:hypothetical protein n=1 Tax=Muricauda brasiliensis TaxID=2162892 RepID=UPI000D3327FD|nr:hypothetical protein [Muricauda brasiliensis]
MKKLKISIVLGIAFSSCFLGVGQVTNSFPEDGKVGIGTLSPQAKLQVNSTGTLGGSWNPSASYFTIFDGSGQKIIMDSNEIYGSHTLHLGSNTGDVAKFRSVFTGSAKDWMIIKEDGKVGIGTTSPQGLLDISSSGTGDAILRLEADTDNNNETYNPMIQMRQDGGIIGADIGFSKNFGDNRFGISPWHSQNGGNIWDVFVIDIATGNIGMGTQSPGTWKLAVKGKIRAEEIKVETGWADYVFNEDYNLPTLEEVEKHIKEKGHLINIPSEKEVEENGIELGEMNKLFLEKIEELTLYIIELKKGQTDLENQNRELLEKHKTHTKE